MTTHDSTGTGAEQDAIERVVKAIDEAWDYTHDGDMIGVRRALSEARYAAIQAAPPVVSTDAAIRAAVANAKGGKA